MTEGDRKLEPEGPDPAKLAQLLEIELMQKRAEWQHGRARGRRIRALSFLFLFIVIGLALLAFFIFFSTDQVSQLRSDAARSASPSAAPAQR